VTGADASSLTYALAGIVTDTAPEGVPPAVRNVARRAILDTVGVALAGANEECVRIVREVVLGDGPTTGNAQLIGATGRVNPLDAALINGTAAHALDYDDTHQSFRGHPSASIVPAAIVAAETAAATGAELVAAYALGLEVAGRVGRAVGVSHAAHGFHSTSTLGVIGATAAAARLLRLDRAQTATAFGIAASSAAGLRLNFGFMAKPLHAGNAARAGLLAAQLAGRGFTANTAAFDGPGGFIGTYSPGDGDPAAVAPGDGTWQALDPGIAVKKYPCCNRGHRAIDATLALVAAHDLHAADVECIEVHMPAGEVDDAGRVGPMVYPRPETGLQAKFSMQYVIAAAVVERGLGVRTFADASVGRPDVQHLRSRVRPIADEDRPASDPDRNFVRVIVRRTDGRELADQIWFPRGDPRGGVDLTNAELAAKFRDCATAVLSDERAAAALRLLERLDTLEDVRTLTASLTP
jgi:2-methylcitrate dehydratase PrpD